MWADMLPHPYKTLSKQHSQEKKALGSPAAPLHLETFYVKKKKKIHLLV